MLKSNHNHPNHTQIETRVNAGEKKPERIFTPEQMENILGFYQALKKVHTRLINEGYKFESGRMIPPKNRGKLHRP